MGIPVLLLEAILKGCHVLLPGISAQVCLSAGGLTGEPISGLKEYTGVFVLTQESVSDFADFLPGELI